VSNLLSEFKIFFIGVGGTHPTKKHFPPSIAVKLDSDILLLDCGEGCVRGLFHFGISSLKIRFVVLTHLHGDHVFGLPSLIHTMALYNRNSDLYIIGPKGTLNFVQELVSIFPYYPSYKILVKEVSKGDIIELEKYRISFGPADHDCEAISVRIDEKAPIYKIDMEKVRKFGIYDKKKLKDLSIGKEISINDVIVTPEDVSKFKIIPRSVVYSGDTRPLKEMIEFAKNSRVLIHDSTYLSSMKEVAKEYAHSTAEDAARIALEAHVDFLFLFHYSPRIKDEKALVKEARAIFPRSALSRDLTCFKVPRKYVEIKSNRVLYV